MTTATYLEKDQSRQQQATIYWFGLNGEIWGVVESLSGNAQYVDCDGCPVNTEDAKNIDLTVQLAVTEQMRMAV